MVLAHLGKGVTGGGMVTAQTCKLKYLHTGPGGPFGGRGAGGARGWGDGPGAGHQGAIGSLPKCILFNS